MTGTSGSQTSAGCTDNQVGQSVAIDVSSAGYANAAAVICALTVNDEATRAQGDR